eukprot:gene9283-10249_t
MYPDDWRVGDVVSDNNISFVETNVLLMEIYIVGSLCTSIPALGHPEGSALVLDEDEVHEFSNIHFELPKLLYLMSYIPSFSHLVVCVQKSVLSLGASLT